MRVYDRNGDLIATSDNPEVIKRLVKNVGQDNVVVAHEVCWIDDTTCPECSAEGVV